MSSQNIEWISEDEIELLLSDLQKKYSGDPINLVSYNPIGYVCGLEAVSGFYEDDVLMLASVICRSIIQGHPLQDGNKRLGMYLANYFLELNNFSITAGNDEYVETALSIARGEMNLETVYHWFNANSKLIRG